MTDTEKLNAIVNLLTDKSAGELAKRGNLNEEESFGALLMIGYLFNRAGEVLNT